MDANTADDIDAGHPIFEAFRVAGYPAVRLKDPGHVTPDDITSGEWRIVRWNGHGIEMFDVDTVEETDRGGIDFEVPFANGTRQPIAFAQEMGPLNDEIPPVEKLNYRNRAVTFFAPRDAIESPVELTEYEAVEALSFWGSEGWVPKTAAEAMADAFGADDTLSFYKDDPDARGIEIARADNVAKALAGMADGVDQQSADRDVNGHKKRRRQTFYRNLDALKEHVGIGE